MKENIVSFQVAKLAKEKGFDGLCFDAYNTHKMKYSNGWLEYIDDNEIEIPFTSKVLKPEDILSPTQSLLQKWLKEEHHLIVIVAYQYEHDSTPYSYWIYKENDSLPLNQWINDLKTYEEALELGLEEALNLIK